MRALILFGWLCTAAVVLGREAMLPVYVEESHAGSFYWLAQRLPLDEPHVLVLVDDHSDASALFGSDYTRESIRRVGGDEERERLFDRWRRDGLIQCFGWIEPLMPRPLERVAWLCDDGLAEMECADRQTAAREALDGHEEAKPRKCGSLADRFDVVRAGSVTKWLAEKAADLPVVATIDLDAFAGRPVETQPALVGDMFSRILALPRLRALTVCLSRPWLTDEAEADRLYSLAFGELVRTDNAMIQFEPYRSVGEDRSEKSQELAARGLPMPTWTPENASLPLRQLFSAHRDRLLVTHEHERWGNLLDEWRRIAGDWRIEVPDCHAGTDGVVRIADQKPPVFRVVARSPAAPPAQRVTWRIWRPEHPSVNLTPDWEAKGFAENAPTTLRRRVDDLATAEGRDALDPATAMKAFDGRTGWGTARLQAEVVTAAGTCLTPPLQVQRRHGSGFRGALTGQFGQPYVFGSTWLDDGTSTGPELGAGADCANFLAVALRDAGIRVPWGSADQLKSALEPVRGTFLPEDVGRGVMVHFGSHVAALFEDRPPLGQLNDADVLAHHLENWPELIPLGNLRQGRAEPTLWRVPPDRPAAARLIIGGDVMLARGVGEKMRTGGDPFAPFREALSAADCAIVNLECALAHAPPPEKKRYVFQADAALSTKALRDAGIDAVSLANNHSADAGKAGLGQTITALEAAGIRPILDGQTALLTVKGLTVALIGVNFIETPEPSREALARRFFTARRSAQCVIVLPHWGDEGTPQVNDEQRDWARWFVGHGADAVIGSHPHVTQFADRFAGRPVIYSLGNLIFDMPGNGSLVAIDLDEKGSIVAERLFPVSQN